MTTTVFVIAGIAYVAIAFVFSGWFYEDVKQPNGRLLEEDAFVLVYATIFWPITLLVGLGGWLQHKCRRKGEVQR